MQKLGYFVLGLCLGMLAMWALLAFPLEAEAITIPQKHWCHYFDKQQVCHEYQTFVSCSTLLSQNGRCSEPEPTPTPTPEPTCEAEAWSCEACQTKLSRENLCYEDHIDFCKSNHGCYWDDGWFCDPCEEPEPEPTPTPVPHVPGPDTSGPPASYFPMVCEGDGPKAPTLQMVGVNGDCVTWRLLQTDPFDHAFFNYGYSPENLEYGIPHLNNNTVDFDTCLLDTSRHIWGQVGTERNYCVSYSEVIDP